MDCPTTTKPLDLFELRHDLASLSTALGVLRGAESFDAERSRRIFEMSVERLGVILERLDRHLVPHDPRIQR